MLSSSNLQQSMVGLSMLDAGMFPSGAESYPYKCGYTEDPQDVMLLTPRDVC